MKGILIKAFLSVLVLGIASEASPEIIVYNVSGTITEVSGNPGVTITPGVSTFVGTFLYDSEAPPQSSGPDSALYPAISVSITVEGTYTTQSESPQVVVYNDFFCVLFFQIHGRVGNRGYQRLHS